eukprot:TRINITY_DN1360_c0_g1_i1.p1 TRINITY_DN1360_c0_g1~~TRINITY_DN1360_c0_g1_i1.p1  ORF type:complete len:176 (-),score=69.73 TRINITY_DN1360_c0_g1_i1:64-591(-)
MKFLFCLLFISFFIQINAKSEFLEVTKTVTKNDDNTFTVQVGYRSLVGSGRITEVKIFDSLPVHLEVGSGKLVLKGSNPTDEWTYNTYQVVPTGIDFTLDKRTKEFVLPATEITFTKDGNAVETVKTESLPITVELPVPKGSIHLSPVVGFFTLVLPVVAAYFLIDQAAKDKKKK